MIVIKKKNKNDICNNFNDGDDIPITDHKELLLIDDMDGTSLKANYKIISKNEPPIYSQTLNKTSISSC